MNAKDVFGIVVRTVGLLAVLTWPFVFLALLLSGGDPAQVFWPMLFYLLFALYLLRGAPLLVAFSYPQRRGALDR